MPILTDLIFYHGEDVALRFAMTPPSSIAGWSLQFSLKDPAGSSILFTKVTGGGIVVTDAVNGVFTVSIAAADTLPLAVPALYLYDVARTDTGAHSVLAAGQVTLMAGVTY